MEDSDESESDEALEQPGALQNQTDIGTGDGCSWVECYTPEQLRDHQLRDSNLAMIIGWLESRWEPDQSELLLASPGVKNLWLCKTQLEVKNGVLFYKWENPSSTKLRLVVPKSLVDEVLIFLSMWQ